MFKKKSKRNTGKQTIGFSFFSLTDGANLDGEQNTQETDRRHPRHLLMLFHSKFPEARRSASLHPKPDDHGR